MSAPEALEIWRQLAVASPHGCRVHLTGGEPFGDYGRLIELCRDAQREGLGPLEKVETNGFWATDEALVRLRLDELNKAGMEAISISADPYHQQFVPIEQVRMLSRVASETLSSDRVQVRWRDWLVEGFDTGGLTPDERRELFEKYSVRGRERFCGRAAELLAGDLPIHALQDFAGKPCRNALLRGRHVHVFPGGLLMPGTCAGIILGRVGPQTVAGIWRGLSDDPGSHPLAAILADHGPLGLLDLAVRHGYRPRDGYAGKCHLCWELRKHLARQGVWPDELSPAWLYEEEDLSGSSE